MRLAVLALALTGCVNLDSFAFNPVHCSTVGPDTCDPADNEWDRVCVPCDEDYDWTRDYPWFPTMLGPAESVRPIPNADVTQITIQTQDGLGELDTYWLPSHGRDPALARTTILYNHGNYAGVEHYQPRVRVLHELGYNVLIYDYRGYGKSQPDTPPSAQQFLSDAQVLRQEVKAFAPDASKIVVYGYSLGGVAAVEAALQEEPCALMLEAPFTSASAIGVENTLVDFPETFLSEGSFDNIRKIEGYAGPLFAFVGSEDTRFPPSSVERIVENAAGPAELWVLEGEKHGISDGGVVEAGMAEYANRMRTFLETTAPGCLTE